MLETFEDRDPQSLSSINPTPRDNDPALNAEAINSTALSNTLDNIREINEGLEAGEGKDVSKTMREILKDENGQIIEEKDEDSARDDILQTNREDDSDNIERATD